MHNRTQGYVFALSGSIFLLLYCWAWFYIFRFLPLNHDAGYYLSCAERIVEGWRPYVDFQVHYPPVGIYYFALFRQIFGEGSGGYRISLLVVEVFTAYLVFLLSRSVTSSKALRFAGASLYLLLYLSCSGSSFVLEYFVVTFSIITILLLKAEKTLRLPAFLAGVSFLLAVMSKQYGVVNAPVVVFLLFKNDDSPADYRSGLVRGVLFVAGFFVTLLVLLLCLRVDLQFLFSQLKGTGYGMDGIAAMVDGLFHIKNIWLSAVILSGVYVFLKYHRFDDVLLLLLCILNLLPTYVREYTHYYQLSLPYGVILFMALVDRYIVGGVNREKEIGGRVIFITVGCTLALSLAASLQVPLYYGLKKSLQDYLPQRVYEALKVDKKTISETLELAKEIQRVLPALSAVAVINEPSYWYLCNFRPPTRENGYRFISERTVKTYDFNTVAYIVWFRGNLLDYRAFFDKVKETHRRMAVPSSLEKERVEIWVKR